MKELSNNDRIQISIRKPIVSTIPSEKCTVKDFMRRYEGHFLDTCESRSQDGVKVLKGISLI